MLIPYNYLIFWIVNGYDENGETYFESEYQLFEVGTGGFNGNKTNPHLSRLAEPKTTIPDAILEFPLFVPKGGYKEMMSDSDMEISFYSPLHPRQHYSRHPDIPDPVPHGRYMFSGVIRIILFEYGNANADKLKAAKVRECKHHMICPWLLLIRNEILVFRYDLTI